MQVVATDYVQNYVRHISDGSPPKAEYMRHFEATSPRALGGCDVLTTGPGARFAEIEARRSTKIEGNQALAAPSPSLDSAPLRLLGGMAKSTAVLVSGTVLVLVS